MDLILFRFKNYRIIIFLLGLLVYFPFLGKAPLFDWDEVNFAESAREMIVSGNYFRVQINFQPFWEKPPLFFWMQALSMKIFGINEYAARFPNALFGLLTLLTVFEIGKKIKNERLGFIWSICLLVGFLPHVYFKSGIIDPVFNYFIFLSLYFIATAYSSSVKGISLKNMAIAGAVCGLAILTKGPVGLLIPLLTIFIVWLINRKNNFSSLKGLILFLLCSIAISLFWFLPETIINGPWFIEEFIQYQIRLFSTPDAGHAQPFYYHFVVVLLGCFPISVLALDSFVKKGNSLTTVPAFTLWMKVLFWVVILLFSMVKTKIIHYSSLTYLPLSFLSALAVEKLWTGNAGLPRFFFIFYWFAGIFIGIAMIFIPLIGMFPEKVLPYISDPFVLANLSAKVNWSPINLFPGIIWCAGMFVAFIFALRRKNRLFMGFLFSCIVISTSFFLVTFPLKIAGYTQGAVIKFYSTIKGKDVYVETLSFKSFAQYFYFSKQGLSKNEIQNSIDETGLFNQDKLRDWYLKGKIDKPVYFVVKSIHVNSYMDIPGMKFLYAENGFSFLCRKP